MCAVVQTSIVQRSEVERSQASLLFTDIEGSTRLLRRLGDQYTTVLEDHHRLIRQAISTHHGIEANTMGDGFFAIFEDTCDAVSAAVEAQILLSQHDWPAGGNILVRMGIHSGSTKMSNVGYIGLDIHQSARICASAHGGQIIISNNAKEELNDCESEDVPLKSLGTFQLKDFDAPESLYQVLVHGLLSEFPPPRTKDANIHNLPSDLTDFVGRDKVLEQTQQIIKTARLMTLFGPGGIGKTRLSKRLAASLLQDFKDGVFYVALESIRDPNMIPSMIARDLNLQEQSDQPIIQTLIQYLFDKHILLVLDNFEQLKGGEKIISELLKSSPYIKIIVTSRIVLNLQGEYVYTVPAMQLPEGDISEQVEEISKIESVDLFIRRSTSVSNTLNFDVSNLKFVCNIVRHLEGIPLSIELAAALTRRFTLPQLQIKLQSRLQLLKNGPEDLPQRHQVLRETIKWGYELLTVEEQSVLRNLGIFEDGFSLEAAEFVLNENNGEDLSDLIFGLTEQSFLHKKILGGEWRFFMLETIREFALEELLNQDNLKMIQNKYISYYLNLAEESEEKLHHNNPSSVHELLQSELANIRSCLTLYLEKGESHAGLRMNSAIWRFWNAVGLPNEGRQWLGQFLAIPSDDEALRAKAIAALAGIAYWQADYQEAISQYRLALEIYLQMNDSFNVADMLFSLSTTHIWSGNAEKGEKMAHEALQLFEADSNLGKVGMVKMAIGFARWMQGDLKAAEPLWDESLSIARQVHDDVEAATKLLAIGSIKFGRGKKTEALLDALQSLEELINLKHVTFTVMALDWIAALAVHADPEGGIKLAGAVHKLRIGLGGGMKPESSGLENPRLVAARKIDPNLVEMEFIEGQEMKYLEAINYAKELVQHIIDKKNFN